jgi:hypothetical protein
VNSAPPQWNDPRNPPVPAAGRFVGAVVGFVFAGIGVTVLVFMWATPRDDFHSPPIFFRIFASFIAIAFVAVGGGIGVSALRARAGGGTPVSSTAVTPSPPAPAAPSASAAGYNCPNCGAALGAGADVSPSGDVKCAFCGRWFNVHRGT